MSPREGERSDRLLSFVVPRYDEEAGIDVLCTALERAGERAGAAGLVARWEAVLVDDGSSDGSARLLARWAQRDPRFRIVRHEVNQGIGGALISGLAQADGDVLLYTDADLPFDLDGIEDLLGPVISGAADLVSARRIGRSREGRWRAVQSWAFNAMIQLVFRLRVRDVNFACKVARRDAVPPSLTSRTGMIDVEWLLFAHDHGERIVQPAVEFEPRRWGRSTLGGVRTIPPMLADLRRIRSARRRRADA